MFDKITKNTNPTKLHFDNPIPKAPTKTQHFDKSVHKYQTYFDTTCVAHAAGQGDGREMALQTTPILRLRLLHGLCFPTRRSLKCKPPTTAVGQTDPAKTNGNNKMCDQII